LLTSLTYQSVTLPGRGGDDLDQQARTLWLERLIEKGQAQNDDEARYWLADLKRHNPDYYEQRLGAYRKQVRDLMAQSGDALRTLHVSAVETLGRLRQRGVGLVILDECHHLLGHWGRVLADAHDLLEGPVVVALTATPPDRDGKPPADVKRYDEFLGPVDYEVPVPAVVKDGFLAPYQDLAYFVRPTSSELAFVANADEELHKLVEELCEPFPQPGDSPAESAFTDPAANDAPPASVVVTENVPTEDDPTTGDDDLIIALPAAEIPVRRLTATKIQDAPNPPQRENLPHWLTRVLTEFRLPTGRMKDWRAFEKRDPDFAWAARVFLQRRGLPLPAETPPPLDDLLPDEVPEMELLAPVLDRYVRHHLRRSRDPLDRALAERVINRLRMLGVQITETGFQSCASPVGRVMAYSQSKAEALAPILATESQLLGERLRAVVVADYERSSAVAGLTENLLDSEAGGAVAAFRVLTSNPETDRLHPVLLTGSSVLLDDDIAETLVRDAREWLVSEKYEVELSLQPEAGFHVLVGRGRDWCPRVYVELLTELFQRGVTKCLVGTRGLLGEGWDANRINVLIDLTTVTTSMTVNQLRGRSIRLDPLWPQKIANNWDVVCLAPEFTKGLDDYRRFRQKHETLFGVTDDGAIEKGVGHVHPAFTRLKPEGLEGSVNALNAEMLSRASRRDGVRGLWKVGQPYRGAPLRALEVRPLRTGDVGVFPPFPGAKQPWNAQSLALAVGQAVLGSLTEAGLLRTGPQVQTAERAGGYVRLFLEQASEDESIVFTTALHQALGPLVEPRYVIPRQVDRIENTWLSSLLPTVVGRYFQRRRREQVMLHAVPYALAKNKELVAIFQRYWNQHVSPGEAVFCQRGAGENVLDEARRAGQSPPAWVHEKEVFL
jgi:hypothetical protein